MSAQIKHTETEADPVERARAIVEADTPPAKKPTGRALKQRREIVACIMDEHVESLAVTVPAGAIDRANQSVGRLRTLLGELKALEGWTWEADAPGLAHEPDPILFFIEQCRGGWRETYCMELEAAETLPTEAERNKARQAAADRQEARLDAVKKARPTTIVGAAALARFMVEMEEELASADAGAEFLEALAAALEGLSSKVVKA